MQARRRFDTNVLWKIVQLELMITTLFVTLLHCICVRVRLLFTSCDLIYLTDFIYLIYYEEFW